MAAPGENGPIVFDLSATGGTDGTFDGRFEVTEEQIEALRNGDLYVQLHTETYAGGELRGALTPVAE